tara:strand:+ start:295 stop:822 length:528 start_codon:yes stop_codon:yes gene_type:complete
MEMLKDFDISSFKKMKPPGDNSITTKNEIKELQKIPIRKKFIKEMDDGEKLFTNIVGEDVKIGELISESLIIINKLKKHFNRPRPAVLAKKIGIELKDIKLKSMDSPSYPSGHATQATLLSLFLSDKYPEKENKLKKLARDIIHSRQVAHTHYKSDNLMGEKLGKQMYNHIKNKI